MEERCKACGNLILVTIFKGGDWCSEYCRKVLAGEIACRYEIEWTDAVGDIPICQVHSNNSKWPVEQGPTRPCLTVDPYDEMNL
jgi:hypothetical protein